MIERASRPIVRLLLIVIAASVAGCTTSTLSSTNPSPLKCQVTVNDALPAIGPAGGTAMVSLAAQPECAWTASADVSWIAEVRPSSGQGSAQVEVRVAANSDPAARRGTIKIGGTDVPITQEAAACSFALSPPVRSLPAAGGSTTFSVATGGGCTWTPALNVPWITITSVEGATVTLAIARNTGAVRNGVLTVGGQTAAITQASADCTYEILPAAQNIGASGGPGTPLSIATEPRCTWTVTSSDAWLTMTSPTSGTGDGSLSFAAAANAGASPRTGTLTVGGQSATVTQSAAPIPCSYSINPTSQTIVASGGAGTNITVTTTPACPWNASSNAVWITTTSSGAGTGTAIFTAGVNAGAQRSGTITIGGQTFTVTQDAASPACTYGINPTSQSVGASAGPGSSITVTTNSGCPWTAVSGDSWISATGAGPGPGTVNFSVDANTGAARMGTIAIGGQTFTVTQSAPCSYGILPTSDSAGVGGGAGPNIAVTAGTGCGWTAVSNDGWITVTGGTPGSGPGTVTYSVAANSGGTRSGTMTIAGQTFTVSQDACTYQVSPTSLQSFSSAGGTGTPVSVTTPASCSWTASSNAAWITVGGASGPGSGTVTFTVDPFVGGTLSRSGTLTIATQPVTIEQQP